MFLNLEQQKKNSLKRESHGASALCTCSLLSGSRGKVWRAPWDSGGSGSSKYPNGVDDRRLKNGVQMLEGAEDTLGLQRLALGATEQRGVFAQTEGGKPSIANPSCGQRDAASSTTRAFRCARKQVHHEKTVSFALNTQGVVRNAEAEPIRQKRSTVTTNHL